jgi:hypothetical protein
MAISKNSNKYILEVANIYDIGPNYTNEKYMLLTFVCPYCARLTNRRGPDNCVKQLSHSDLVVYVPGQYNYIKEKQYVCIHCCKESTLVYYTNGIT